MATISESKSSGSIKVKIVTSSPDLFVYVTTNQNEAKASDSIWLFDERKGKTKIRFVTSSEDVKIQYVDSKTRAGWRNKSHRLQNRFG